ncbi:VOC family protein [Chitinophaga sp. sic0106]|uniref:VOC family protein n=1 Tax=Chitinophaga sp. sic0106 TaxID=2854785 RepID=UPI001C457CDB|nr:VOC family protein [Chitinophaga sp. sic0106]MBV7530970.1 VOC family protein [Chitinophaga sp. sic0106]
MQKLQKIDAHTNVLTWFEIPAEDLDRAKKFYETILGIQMEKRKDGDHESVFFPYDPKVVQATSGRVTGVLAKSERHTPSANGTVVYINASPDLQTVLDRVVPAGGKLLSPKVQIPAGYIAIILDSEGNKVGLHAEK